MGTKILSTTSFMLDFCPFLLIHLIVLWFINCLPYVLAWVCFGWVWFPWKAVCVPFHGEISHLLPAKKDSHGKTLRKLHAGVGANVWASTEWDVQRTFWAKRLQIAVWNAMASHHVPKHKQQHSFAASSKSIGGSYSLCFPPVRSLFFALLYFSMLSSCEPSVALPTPQTKRRIVPSQGPFPPTCTTERH